MTKEQKLLIELLAHSITGCDIQCDTADIDWAALIKESISQTVSVIAFDSVTPIKTKIPEDIYKQWFNHSYGSMAINSLVEKNQKELTALLAQNGYDYLILKGLSSASYYPKPELRALGDVDFLINPEKKEEIKQLLVLEGYTPSLEDHICHIVFNKPKSHLEMHFEISGVPEGENGKKIRSFMRNALNEAGKITVCGNTFNAPSNKHHALILLLHMQHHMLGEGIGLRHLQDWACFVNRTLKESFWKDKLIPFLKEIGLFTYMNVLTAVCVSYLKIPAPDWLRKAEQSLCQDIIEDILSGGNFGKKDSLRGKSGLMISNRGKDGTSKSKAYYLHKHLKSAVEKAHPWVKRYKALYPFAYFYRMVRYFLLSLCGKRTPFTKTIPLAEKRKNIYNKLRIFEVNGNE